MAIIYLYEVFAIRWITDHIQNQERMLEYVKFTRVEFSSNSIWQFWKFIIINLIEFSIYKDLDFK